MFIRNRTAIERNSPKNFSERKITTNFNRNMSQLFPNNDNWRVTDETESMAWTCLQCIFRLQTHWYTKNLCSSIFFFLFWTSWQTCVRAQQKNIDGIYLPRLSESVKSYLSDEKMFGMCKKNGTFSPKLTRKSILKRNYSQSQCNFCMFTPEQFSAVHENHGWFMKSVICVCVYAQFARPTFLFFIFHAIAYDVCLSAFQ